MELACESITVGEKSSYKNYIKLIVFVSIVLVCLLLQGCNNTPTSEVNIVIPDDVQAIIDMIDEISVISEDTKDVIINIENQYSILPAEQRELINNIDKLEKIKDEYESFLNNKRVEEEVNQAKESNNAIYEECVKLCENDDFLEALRLCDEANKKDYESYLKIREYESMLKTKQRDYFEKKIIEGIEENNIEQILYLYDEKNILIPGDSLYDNNHIIVHTLSYSQGLFDVCTEGDSKWGTIFIQGKDVQTDIGDFSLAIDMTDENCNVKMSEDYFIKSDEMDKLEISNLDGVVEAEYGRSERIEAEKRYQNYKRTQYVAEAIKEQIELQSRTPHIGMTKEELGESTWGKPRKINTSTYEWGTIEQWCYSGYRYIYLEDGIVTGIQDNNK